MKMVEKRDSVDKWIVYAGMLLITMLLLFIWWFYMKWFKYEWPLWVWMTTLSMNDHYEYVWPLWVYNYEYKYAWPLWVWIHMRDTVFYIYLLHHIRMNSHTYLCGYIQYVCLGTLIIWCYVCICIFLLHMTSSPTLTVYSECIYWLYIIV